MHDLRNLTLILWRRLWLVLAATALGGLLAFWGMIKIGRFPRYSATAVVAIGGDVYYNTQDTGYLEMADAMLENYRRLASLEIVTKAIGENLQLPDSPQDIAKTLDVLLIEDTNLLSVKATYANPRTAAAIANEAARQLTMLAPTQARNFVLIMETAVPPTMPDTAAVIPPMMAAIAAFLTAVGGLLLHAYVRQPILSESDLAPIPLPTLATIHGTDKSDWVNWWALKSACERLWAEKRDAKTDGQWPSHLLLTAPTPIVGQAAVAARLAQIWRLDSQAKGLIDAIDLASLMPIAPLNKSGAKRLSLQTAQAIVETARETALQHQTTIFSAPPVRESFASLLMAQHAEMTVLLIPLGHAQMPQIEETIALLAGQGVTVDGLVVLKGSMAVERSIWSILRRWGSILRFGNGRSQNIIDAKKAVEPEGAS
jgi:capsular polysaccharide biosynthesis protein